MKQKKLKEERVTIRLEPNLKKELEKLAAASDKPLAHFIRSELRRLVTEKTGK